MDRDAVIERLIAAQLEKLNVGQYSRRFLQVVEREFLCLGRMSDEELVQEMAQRGLEAGALPDPEDYDDDDDEDDDDEASWLVKDMHRADDDWAPSYG